MSVSLFARLTCTSDRRRWVYGLKYRLQPTYGGNIRGTYWYLLIPVTGICLRVWCTALLCLVFGICMPERLIKYIQHAQRPYILLRLPYQVRSMFLFMDRYQYDFHVHEVPGTWYEIWLCNRLMQRYDVLLMYRPERESHNPRLESDMNIERRLLSRPGLPSSSSFSHEAEFLDTVITSSFLRCIFLCCTFLRCPWQLPQARVVQTLFRSELLFESWVFAVFGWLEWTKSWLVIYNEKTKVPRSAQMERTSEPPW